MKVHPVRVCESNSVISALFTIRISSLEGYVNEAEVLCGLVVRVPGYRSRDPSFNSWRYQIF
jgi:hypothetical protein